MTKNRSVRDMSKEEILYRLLKKQLGYYQAVLDLTEQEHDALNAAKGFDRVPSLMKKKTILMSIIEELDQALKPVKDRWQKNKNEDDPFAPALKEQLSELDSTLKKTLEIDAKNQRLFQEKLLALRNGQMDKSRR